MELFSDYPPSSFYFKVVFTLTGNFVDTSFQDVSGISGELNVEEVEEGGENRFVYRLPKRVKHANLVLKRGIAGMSSPLVLWCKSVIEGDLSLSVETMPVTVYLMNEYQVPIRGWIFGNAYPVKWEVGEFNSTKNEVALETIELSYSTLNRIV